MREAFSCGVEWLDRYLKQQASQDVRKRVAVPCVLVSSDDRMPDLVKRLKLPRYPAIGATLLGRLARYFIQRKGGRRASVH